MKKVIVGCCLILCAVIWLCTLVCCGYIMCVGKQGWMLTQFGLRSVLSELTILVLIIPFVLIVIGILFIRSGFQED